MMIMLLCVTLGSVLPQSWAKCAYDVDKNYYPYKTDQEAFNLTGLATQCTDYLGEGGFGCCNLYNDQNSALSYRQIDGVFGSDGGACDICAINLKRFWCQYACSERQADFMTVSDQLVPYPDPQHPGETLMVQIVNLTVFGQTACDLYQSCKRNSFVSSVSAMGSPAGFLAFQGANAVNNAHQLINVVFSDDMTKALTMSNKTHKQKTSDLTPCQYQTSEKIIHGFSFKFNCTCNSCEESCQNENGFVYTEPEVFEDFDSVLVGVVYASTIGLAILLTVYRHMQNKKKKRQ